MIYHSLTYIAVILAAVLPDIHSFSIIYPVNLIWQAIFYALLLTGIALQNARSSAQRVKITSGVVAWMLRI